MNSDTLIDARTELAVAKDKLIHAALRLAATAYAEADDPGWEAEMYEEQLDAAVKEYVSRRDRVSMIQRVLAQHGADNG